MEGCSRETHSSLAFVGNMLLALLLMGRDADVAAAAFAVAQQQVLTQEEAAQDVPHINEPQELAVAVQGLLLRPLDTGLMGTRACCYDWSAEDALRGKRSERLLHCRGVSEDGNMLQARQVFQTCLFQQ